MSTTLEQHLPLAPSRLSPLQDQSAFALGERNEFVAHHRRQFRVGSAASGGADDAADMHEVLGSGETALAVLVVDQRQHLFPLLNCLITSSGAEVVYDPGVAVTPASRSGMRVIASSPSYTPGSASPAAFRSARTFAAVRGTSILT
jgi:hypothetical protein